MTEWNTKAICESALDDTDESDVYDRTFTDISDEPETYTPLTPEEYVKMKCVCVTYMIPASSLSAVRWPMTSFMNSRRVVRILRGTEYIRNARFMIRFNNDSIRMDRKNFYNEYIDVTEADAIIRAIDHIGLCQRCMHVITAGLFFDTDPERTGDVEYDMDCMREIAEMLISINSVIPTFITPMDTCKAVWVTGYMDYDSMLVVRKEHPYMRVNDFVGVLTRYAARTQFAKIRDFRRFINDILFGDPDSGHTDDEIERYFSMPAAVGDAIHALGYNYRFMADLEYDLKDSGKSLLITVPRGDSLMADGLDIGVLGHAVCKRDPQLAVDGVMYISKLHDLCNMRYLKKDYTHNKLVLGCRVSPAILRSILIEDVRFATIDMRSAKLTRDMTVDMSNPAVKCPECRILTGPGLTVIPKNIDE